MSAESDAQVERLPMRVARTSSIGDQQRVQKVQVVGGHEVSVVENRIELPGIRTSPGRCPRKAWIRHAMHFLQIQLVNQSLGRAYRARVTG